MINNDGSISTVSKWLADLNVIHCRTFGQKLRDSLGCDDAFDHHPVEHCNSSQSSERKCGSERKAIDTTVQTVQSDPAILEKKREGFAAPCCSQDTEQSPVRKQYDV
jgi:hypothetical protein